MYSLKSINLKNLNKFLDKVRQEYELYAPVKEENLILFKKIEDMNDICFFYKNTNKPLKELFFPQTQELFGYELSKKNVKIKEPSYEERQRVIFGTRACDTKSLFTLDKVFGWDYKDSFYFNLRNLSTIITVACQQINETCFCNYFGNLPFEKESSDIFLTLIEDTYYVEIITDRGSELISKYPDLFKDTSDTKKLTKYEFEKKINLNSLKEKLYKNFSHPLWEEEGIRCLGCGICSYLCPTCHCFDITDELIKKEGKRFRCWDSCSFSSFTKMPAHQPREEQFQRLRQRIMHKFAYFPDRFNDIACVGCGRCINYCPVNIDLRELIDKINKIE